jgi:hypothetical protein
VQHTADSVARDVHWLDDLIAAERAHSLSAATTTATAELTYEGDIR